MPALQPDVVPDKAMTLDLAALQSANAPPAATTAAVPAPENTEFSEPQTPWVQPEPAPGPAPAAAPGPASAQPPPPPPPPAASSQQRQNPWAGVQSQKAAQASAATAAPSRPAAEPVMPPAGPPANSAPAPAPPAGPPPTATLAGPAETDFSEPRSTSSQPAPSRTAVNPPVPSELKQTHPSKPAAAPPNGTGAPPQRQCFTNAEGVKICYMYDQQNHNTTDIHKEGGVNDYHNQAGGREKEGIQGHLPGNNITSTLNNLGQNPPPNEHKDGNTVFQGKTDIQVAHQHDIHKDNSTFTDHDINSGDGDFDWKSAYKGPDGDKEMAEINKDGQYKDEEDTRVDADGKNKVDSEEFKGSDDHRFMSDKPGIKDDSSLTWDEDWQQKKQKAEFQGKGVYDLHEESSSEHKVKAKVDGDQGWQDFEQDMNDFDNTFFDEDAEWKQKMQDPRYRASATTSAGHVMAGPSSTAGVVKRAGAPMLVDSDSDKFAIQTRGKASNPYKEAWQDFKDSHEEYEYEKTHQPLEPIIVDIPASGPYHSTAGIVKREEAPMMVDVDGEKFALHTREQPEVGELEPRGEALNPFEDAGDYFEEPVKEYGYDETHKLLEPLGIHMASRDLAVKAREPMFAAMTAANSEGSQHMTKPQMDKLGIAVAVLLGFLVVLTVGCCVRKSARRRWQSRRERQDRRRYMREIEGFHSLDAGSGDENRINY